METWQSLIIGLCGIGFVGDIILHFVLPSRRRKDNAESEHAQHDADKAEVDILITELEHQEKTVENLLKLVDSLTARLSTLNATVDKHIDRYRELADRAYKSETELNRANERIIVLTEERDDARILAEHYKRWHCRKSNCNYRLPPNEELKGLTYIPPESESAISTVVNAQ